jgi:diguanylate cyclase (GGDEF)-like protein
MSDGINSLGLATAATVVAATSLTGFGLRQRRYEGWQWWVGALWLSAVGAAGASLADSAWGAALAGLLLMPWPVLALQGLRRFHPRQALPGLHHLDWAALGGAVLLVVGAAGAGLQAPTAVALGVVTLHLYAAGVLFLGPSGREFVPVQCLAATMGLSALASALTLLPLGLQPSAWVVQAATAALGTAVLAFVAITLVCERTERQLRDSRRRLRVLANLDTLTQVPNRRHFRELADQALLQDEPGSAVLLVFDVDHFKRINDLFGHAAGDRALALVSSAMLEHLRAHDVPGRQGGDEFVLLLRRTTTRHAMSVAARIVAEVQRRAPGQQLPTLTLSFGVVQIGFGEGIHAAIRRADQAMYEAKRQGRSRAVAAAGDEDTPVFEHSQPLGLTPA